MTNKEFYKEKIVKMINEITRSDILIYIYKIVADVVKEDSNEN